MQVTDVERDKVRKQFLWSLPLLAAYTMADYTKYFKFPSCVFLMGSELVALAKILLYQMLKAEQMNKTVCKQ